MPINNTSGPVKASWVIGALLAGAAITGGIVCLCYNYSLRKCRKRTPEEKKAIRRGWNDSVPLQREYAGVADRERIASDELSPATRRQMAVIDRATELERMNARRSDPNRPGISGIPNTGNRLPEPARIGQDLSSASSESSIGPFPFGPKPQQSSFQPPNLSPSAISGKGKAIYRRPQGDQDVVTAQVEIHSPRDKEDVIIGIDLSTAAEGKGKEADVPEEEKFDVPVEEKTNVPEEEKEDDASKFKED